MRTSTAWTTAATRLGPTNERSGGQKSLRKRDQSNTMKQMIPTSPARATHAFQVSLTLVAAEVAWSRSAQPGWPRLPCLLGPLRAGQSGWHGQR